MDSRPATEWPKTTAHPNSAARFSGVVNLDLFDDDLEPDHVAVYLSDPGLGRWPARTINRQDPAHFAAVLTAWAGRGGLVRDFCTVPTNLIAGTIWTPQRAHRLDVHVVALVETYQWSIRKEDEPYIESIVGIYYFDRNTQVHCCEIAPSYELLFLENQVRLNAAGRQLDDEAADRIRDHYEQANTDDDMEYHHCYSIDALLERVEQGKALPYTHHHVGDPYGSLTDDEMLGSQGVTRWEDMMREALSSNAVI